MGLTIGQVLILAGLLYLVIGLMWVIKNHRSRLAIEDRAQWRRERKYWKFIVIPGAVALTWPLWVWVCFRIREMIKTGEADQIASQVMKEHMEKEHGIR